MIWLNSWGIQYGHGQLHDMAKASMVEKLYPGSRAVVPIWLDGKERVLVTESWEAAIVRERKHDENDKAGGIFRVVEWADLAPDEFIVEHGLLDRQETEFGPIGPYDIIFNGTAEFKNNTVYFHGRALPPFVDIERAMFVLVREHIDMSDVFADQYFPVVVGGAQ